MVPSLIVKNSIIMFLIRNNRFFYSKIPTTRALISPRRLLSHQQDDNERPYFCIYYNDVYQVALPPGHRFPMEKYGKVRRLVQKLLSDLPQEKKETVDCEFRVSPLATVEELESTHSKEYIQRFLNGKQTQQEQRNVGFPWSHEGVKRALSSVGGTVAAACDVCEIWRSRRRRKYKNENHHNGTTTTTKLSSLSSSPIIAPWAAHVAGGTHHAFWDYGEGFCVFSDIAVAANVILNRYPDLIKRILIIDLDVHQGNGNAVLFQDNPRVSTFSIQCAANYFSKKESSDLDIDLPVGCSDQTYLLTLNHWLNKVLLPNRSSNDTRNTKYDLIFFQAGVDILEDDRLGRMNISPEGVKRRNELVYEFAAKCNVPLMICMGGGYPRTNDWTPIIQAHANVYFQAHQFLAGKSNNRQKREEQRVSLFTDYIS